MNKYEECAHIKRVNEPASFKVSPNILKEIETSYRTLPTFEETLFKIRFMESHSLERNEVLKCRWAQYKESNVDKVRTPFKFPDHSELHFINGMVRFYKDNALHQRTDFRKKKILGPGVDNIGQMPIPVDLYLKRGTTKKSTKKEKEKPKTRKHGGETDDEVGNPGTEKPKEKPRKIL